MNPAGVLTALCLGSLLSCATPERMMKSKASPDETRARLAEAASAFTLELRSVLLRELQRGALQAISVCSDSAQELTRAVGQRFGVSIRRTSMRFRNKANEPGEHDVAVLERFERLIEAGAESTDLEEFERVEEGGTLAWRLSKPIMVSSSACLRCHGSEANISPEIREFLTKRYPGDRAQNYGVGDFRGIVVVSEITPKDDRAF